MESSYLKSLFLDYTQYLVYVYYFEQWSSAMEILKKDKYQYSASYKQDFLNMSLECIPFGLGLNSQLVTPHFIYPLIVQE